MANFYTSAEVTKERKDGSSDGDLVYQLTAELVSQDIINNTSTVLFTVWMKYSTNKTGSLWSTSYPAYMKLTVDGTTYDPTSNIDVGSSTSSTNYIVDGKIRKYTKSQTYLAVHKKELTFTHRVDGTKSVDVSYTWVPSTSNTPANYMPEAFTAPDVGEVYGVVIPPIDAGKVKIKVNGVWKIGQVFVNVNGSWKKAIKVATKVSGAWKTSKIS